MRSDVLKGQLELVALASLRAGPRHGYAIIKELRERSGGKLDVLEGKLYPALHRLEHAGQVKSNWSTEGGRRQQVYEALKTKGIRSELGAARSRERRAFTRALDAVLGGAP